MSHSELCRYLLHRGAAVNAQDQQGRTALMVACENGSVETVEVLVHGGARVGLMDATGHDAAHYGAATGNALIQHYLQDAAQRHSWASAAWNIIRRFVLRCHQRADDPELCLSSSSDLEEESTEISSQGVLEHGTTCAERSSRVITAKPARTHQHPILADAVRTLVLETGQVHVGGNGPLLTLGMDFPSQDDREAYEEIVRLRQERAQFLQKIRNLEQQQEKRKQELDLEDSSLHVLEKQVEELQKQLVEKTGEKEDLGKELEALRSRLSSIEQNEKDNTSYDIETLQDEEGALLEFPGAELLLSRRSRSVSTEELLDTLQEQVQSLTQKNKDLTEKIQVLENYEKDKTDVEASGDFVPLVLYDSLKSEFDRLKEQHAEMQAILKALAGDGTDGAPGKLIPATASEELKIGCEEQLGALKAAWQKISSSMDQGSGDQEVEGNSGPGTEEGSGAGTEARGVEVEELARELHVTQEQYQEALAEVQLLQEQIELGILLVEDKEVAKGAGSELEAVKTALRQARKDLKEQDQKVKDLEGRLRAQEEAALQGCSSEECEERKSSLAISLHEACREKEALLGRCTSTEAEIQKLKESLEERNRETEKAEGSASESRGLQEEATELQRQLAAVTEQRDEAKAQVEVLREGRRKLEEELASQYVSRLEHEDWVGKLRASLMEAESSRAALQEECNSAQRELAELREASEGYRRESVPLAEHTQAKEALEGTLWELKAKAKLLEQDLKAKAQEASGLRAELDGVRQGAVSKEAHEQLRASLQGEVEALSGKLTDLGRQHERTCTEVFRVQREALFMKSEKHAAEAQLAAAEKQLQSLRAELVRVRELHSHIEDSAKLVQEKDRKITELSKEVFKLKEALNDLSELSGEASPKAASPQKAGSGQEAVALRGTIQDLEQRLAGRMDEDIQKILFQILKMQKLQEQGR
ncbi:Ankyrin repeat domain-containing protein 24 [Varanus komodoensis]|nr:Ankyrin repeat domain-containing protein 24 [Varanus komodoensis]